MLNSKKNFLIYGYGISGKSIEAYFKNKKFTYNIFDDYKKNKNKKFINKKYLLKNINIYDYFVVSPSIKINKKHFLYKYKKKIIIDLDFISLEVSSQKIIGITGTEGKSSTCSYINDLLSKKYNTKIIGNFGETILDKKNLSNYLSKIDFLIIELSSYQLDKIRFLKLHHALITNIFSDHLDYHNTQKNYITSKFKIQNLLYNNGYLYISKEIFYKYKSFIKINKKQLFFFHNKNFLKKNLVTYLKKINLNSIKKLIYNIDSNIIVKNNYIKNELIYRNQIVYKSRNLTIYNDSKCTNLNNAIFKNSLVYNSNKILILGGIIKKQPNFKFNISNTLVLTFGDHSSLFLKHINLINSKFYSFLNLSDLISFLKLIKKVHRYNHILFSPGGESFDHYKNFKDRGRNFNKLIKKII